MRIRVGLPVLIALGLALAVPAQAQPWAASVLVRPAAPAFASEGTAAARDTLPPPPSPAGLDALPAPAPAPLAGVLAGGALGGAAGFLGGALVGVALVNDRNGSDSWEKLSAAFGGAVIGEIVAVPLGAHLANRGRGSFAQGLLASTLAGLATLGLVGAVPDGYRGLALGTGVGAQVLLVTHLERKGTR
jgi:hypothetical protein